ncbi:MAG TPA: RDD family protein [Xanthomonadaceae bacterium]|nr:RDD family protein [Xanthomonadaceae bacterium]
MTTAPRAAGAWRRYAAWSLDFVVLAAPALLLAAPRMQAALQAITRAYEVLGGRLARQLGDALLQGGDPARLAPGLLQDPGVLADANALQSALFALCLPPLVAYAVLGLGYHVGFQCGRWRASPGQHALGLAVARADGSRAAPVRLLLRHLAGSLSWLTLNLGHALALVPPHRTLHDLLAGTTVLDASGEPRLPAWAKAWLALQGLVLVFALAWGVRRYLTLLQAALG